MTQDQFIGRVLAESIKGLNGGELSKQQVEVVTKSVFQQMAEAMRTEGNCSRLGFGRFQIQLRPVREGRNPRTGQVMDIPASAVIRFRAGAGLKRAVTS